MPRPEVVDRLATVPVGSMADPLPFAGTPTTCEWTMSTYTCDGCAEEFDGQRVVFTTEATDDTGLDVTVTKRWTTCPDCADQLFDTIGRKAPWDDGDATVMTMPDDDDHVAAPLGGVSGPIGS